MISALIDQCFQHLSSIRFKAQNFNAAHEKALAKIAQSLEMLVNEIYPRNPNQPGPFDQKSSQPIPQKNGSKNPQSQQPQVQQVAKSQINQQRANRQDDDDQKNNNLMKTMPIQTQGPVQQSPNSKSQISKSQNEDDQNFNKNIIRTQQIQQQPSYIQANDQKFDNGISTKQQQWQSVQTQQDVPQNKNKKSKLDLYFKYEDVVDQEYQQQCGSKMSQTCDICDSQLFDLQERKAVIKLDCGHYFHKQCEEDFLTENKLLECLVCFKNKTQKKSNWQQNAQNNQAKSLINYQQQNLQQTPSQLQQVQQKNKLEENGIVHKRLFQQDYLRYNNKIIDCSICLEPLFDKNHQDYIIQTECQHYYHTNCIEGCVKGKFMQCPNCKKQYGIMIGDQPPGTIKIRYISMSCSGFNCGSIEITYDIPDSQRNNIRIPGTGRRAYLPDNQEGNYIAKLFKIAFDRKLIFTVGRSITTGLDNQVVWNGIHHKTSVNGGPQNFGYPDPTYFTRVLQELADKGIK